MITKKGMVVKKSGTKTVKVEVHEYRAHAKYKKRFRVTKRFLVHDEKEMAAVGDAVLIAPCKPVSKKKTWTLQSVESSSPVVAI